MPQNGWSSKLHTALVQREYLTRTNVTSYEEVAAFEMVPYISDGFESGDASAWGGVTEGDANSTFTFDTPRYGTYGGHVKILAGGTVARVRKTFSAAHVVSAAFSFKPITNPASGKSVGHLEFATSGGTTIIRLEHNGTNFRLMARKRDGTTEYQNLSISMSTGTWYQIVLVYDANPLHAAYQIFVDGVAAASMVDDTAGTVLLPERCDVQLNDFATTSSATECVYDDVIVAPYFLSLLRQVATTSAIASAEVFGTLQANLRIYPTALASAESFGTLRTAIYVIPTGIASAEAIGSPNVAFAISPAGITSDEAFGTLTANLRIYPTALASAEAFGTLRTLIYVTPNGIASAEAVGEPRIASRISPVSIGSDEAFGTLTANLRIYPTALVSAEAFGTLLTILHVTPVGITSVETVGEPRIAFCVSPGGITSDEAFGVPNAKMVIRPVAIVSLESFGTCLVRTTIIVSMPSIASGEAFGIPNAKMVIRPVAIESLEDFGSFYTQMRIYPSSILTGESFGTLRSRLYVLVEGIVSAESVGDPRTRIYVVPAGVASAEVFGSFYTQMRIYPGSISTGEVCGNMRAFTAMLDIHGSIRLVDVTLTITEEDLYIILQSTESIVTLDDNPDPLLVVSDPLEI